jgi:hypothetical protein
VQTVGVVVASIGGGLALGLRRGTPSSEMRLTAGLAAAGLAAVDLLYVAKRSISPVQAADAGLEALFIYGLMRQCRGTRYPGDTES